MRPNTVAFNQSLQDPFINYAIMTCELPRAGACPSQGRVKLNLSKSHHLKLQTLAAHFGNGGTVMKVSGPLVVAENMSGTKMYEAGFAQVILSFESRNIKHCSFTSLLKMLSFVFLNSTQRALFPGGASREGPIGRRDHSLRGRYGQYPGLRGEGICLLLFSYLWQLCHLFPLSLTLSLVLLRCSFS